MWWSRQVFRSLAFSINLDEDKNLLAIANGGGTRIILQALRAEFAEAASNDELMLKIHKVLLYFVSYLTMLSPISCYVNSPLSIEDSPSERNLVNVFKLPLVY